MNHALVLFVMLGASPALACTNTDGLPDPACTPGAIDPAVTQENIHQTICVPGYSKTVRPPVGVTNLMKRRVMQEYGFAGEDLRLYEGDHLVSIELGGCPGPNRGCDFHANYWPGKWQGPDGARDKDRIENALHRLACSGKLPLAEAQRRIAADWRHSLEDQGEAP